MYKSRALSWEPQSARNFSHILKHQKTRISTND